MMRRPNGWRLLAVCVLAGLAGCEQSSYSSTPAESQPAAAAADAVSASDRSTTPPSTATAPSAPVADEPAAEPPTEAQSPAAVASDAAKLPTKDLTFDDIKFDIEKDGKFERSMLTPEIEALVGRSVRIRGYILPTFQQSGIRNFVLVRDNMECCFGPGAALYDCIVVDMVEGQSTDFTTRPVAVEGTFGVQELLDFDGVVRAIYHLEGKAVK